MDIQRFDLPDGAWADIHRRPSHGQVKAVMRAYREHADDGSVMDIQTISVLTLTDKWLVKDGDGREIPLSREGVESAPQEVVNALWNELTTVLEGAFPNL